MVSDTESEALPVCTQIEALLLVAERPITITELSRIIGVSPDAVEDAVAELMAQYAGRGIAVQRHQDALQLATNPGAARVVQRFLGLEMSTRLSTAALETLAIVAYKQPVTRGQIEAIRGVNADHALANLIARELVQDVGRLNAVGRPILYGTTFEFLRAFGLRSLDDLPHAGDGFGPAVRDERTVGSRQGRDAPEPAAIE